MSEQKIELYDGPAGGWGALKSVAHHLNEQGVAVKGAKTLLHANQPDGFDCPGCAWPDRDHRSTFEFCENGAKAVAAEATARRATPEVIAAKTLAEWAEASDYELEATGRLTEPLVYDPQTDRYQRTSWDAAFALIAQQLRALPDPNEAIFYTSGRTSNEAAFLYQLFVREYGTNNFPDCSNMCHEPSGSGLRPTIGVGKGTVTLHDFEQADCILVFGQNPGTNHPRMLGELRAARKRGAKIISFNPLKERGLERFADPQDKLEMLTLGSAPISSHYFQLQVGGDFALLKGMCKRVVELDDVALAMGLPRVLDVDFIAEHANGFDSFLAELREQSWEPLVAASGLSREQIEQAADLYAGSERVIACWGMGITQHRHSVATIQMIVNLLLLRGNLGREGAGACPVRGHSNVQGDRTMGIYEKPAPAFLDKLGEVFGFAPPRAHGVDTVGAIQAMLDGAAKVFIAMGGNFAAATPDTAATWRALRQCELTVHITTKFNRSHVVHGRKALVLPVLGRTEIDMQATGPQGVTVEDSMSMVHLSAGMNAPASEHLLSEPMLVARMAAATLTNSCTPWLALAGDYAAIRDKIEAVLPDFAGFNEKIKAPGGFRLRNTASERAWATPSGRAEFSTHAMPTDLAVERVAERHRDVRVFTLTTLRSHDQYNTTIYGHDDRYRGVYGHRRVVFINAADLKDIGLKAGDWVDITSLYVGETGADVEQRRAERFLLVEYDIPRGCLASYYPETNPLVPLQSFSVTARTPTSKSIPVTLARHGG
ncbi:FdhF/YdeP family oxidoreductase [Roseateles saccharophilus]|uniref:Molybdopterin-dependent oxidoreductase alpha subunit n=1 Tax=Roseateles saccharophilus TaxID=304 RepID=A0A4V2VQZ0_ROSSA|nr:FdhF/YdeP family oxidoreductase [Roseateles saccharophilus]MDG0835269.1 FdhF/YdeP family oxidoreductase [Roseateles saccharophilus]TCU96179.1 molybdopterin-dependent oxidoreductase alpha subunit [Roseateles saccharophilus]